MSSAWKAIRRSTWVAAQLLALVAPGAVQAQVTQVKFGCTGTASSHYAYCTNLAREISRRNPGQNWTVVATGGIRDNFELLNKGEISVGISAPDSLLQFEARKSPYEQSGNSNYRVLWIFNVAPQNIVVRTDSGVNSLADLSGKPFVAGARGTSTETSFKEMFTILGITPTYVSGSYEDAVAAMQDRRVVGFGKASPGMHPDSMYLRLQTATKIKALSFSPEDVKKIRASHPQDLFGDVPANVVIPGQATYTTWVVPLSIIVPKDFPEKLAYEAVKTAVEVRNDIARIYPGVLEDQIGATLKYNMAKLHPGAIRYFEERGFKVPAEQR
jgi:TRAP transporter TAXI family solute receptor